MISLVQTVDVEKVDKLLFSVPVGVKDIQWEGLGEGQYRTVFLSHPNNNKKMYRGKAGGKVRLGQLSQSKIVSTQDSHNYLKARVSRITFKLLRAVDSVSSLKT